MWNILFEAIARPAALSMSIFITIIFYSYRN